MDLIDSGTRPATGDGYGLGAPAAGRRRSDAPTLTGGTGRDGRRRSDDTRTGLRLDACAAAEILAGHSDRWSAEQVLQHREIANLAADEAQAALKAAGRARRSEKQRRREQHDEVAQAIEILREAHDLSLFGP